MAKGKRRIRPEFWIGLIFVALLAYALIADWWKEHAVLGWVILGIVVALLAFFLYRVPAFRSFVFGTAKKAGESIAYDESKVSGRKPLSEQTKTYIYQRAGYKCENPNCKSSVKPEIHHIDGNNSNNNVSNLIALCPNCHDGAGHGRYSKSEVRDWARRSEEKSKRGRR